MPNSGTGIVTAIQTLALSNGSRQRVQIDWSTADGSASAGRDYLESSGRLSFAPGQTALTITNVIKRKPVAEYQKEFFVNLTNAANVTLTRTQGTVTILNTALEPAVSVRDTSAREGDSGETEVVSEIDLSAPSFLPITVAWATEDDTARANLDYLPRAGLLTFDPGESKLMVTNRLIGNFVHEPDRVFRLQLLLADNASIARGQGLVQIQDADPIPALSIADTEQRTDLATNALISVTLSGVSVDPVSVFWFTFDGTAKGGSITRRRVDNSLSLRSLRIRPSRCG